MWPLRTILYFGTFWLACAMSLVNPIWGVVNYLIVYQMDPRGTWWGKPVAELGIRYSMYAIAFTAAGCIFCRKRVPQVRPFFCGWEAGLLLLLVIAGAHELVGIELQTRSVYAEYAFEKMWKMLVFVLLLARLAASRRNFEIVLWTLVGGGLYLGYDAYTAPDWTFADGRLEHVGGPDFSTTSGLAAHLTAMLPLIGVAFLVAKKWWWKGAALLSGAFAVNAIIMCRTRSAFIGLLAGVLAAFWWAPRVRRYRIHALLVVGLLMAYGLTDSFYWTRMGTLASRQQFDADPAAATRIVIWKTALEVLADHPLGVGLGNFPRIIGDYNPAVHKRTSHNTVLVAFVELGVHGGTVFVLLVAGSLWYAYRCLRMASRCAHPVETQLTSYGVLVACVTYVVTGLGTERFLCESFWWVLALPLCLHRVVLGELAPEPQRLALARWWDSEAAASALQPVPHAS